MKKAIMLVLCLAIVGFTVACKKKDEPKSTVTIFADGEQVTGTLVLGSNQSVKLEAVLKDKNGNLVKDYTTVWTCSAERVGRFSKPESAITEFIAFNGSYSATPAPTITADCNGTKKSINFRIDFCSLELGFRGGNSVAYDSVKTFTAEFTRAGVEDTNTPIYWSTNNPIYPGRFVPNPSYSGDTVNYYPNTNSAIGYINVRASALGNTQSLPINITASLE